MKFDHTLFMISKTACENNTVQVEDTSDVRLIKARLVAHIIKAFQSIVNDPVYANDPLQRARFYVGNQGYADLEDLNNRGYLDEFLSDFCMYLSDFGPQDTVLDGEPTKFYEVIWDYKTYNQSFEQRSEPSLIRRYNTQTQQFEYFPH